MKIKSLETERLFLRAIEVEDAPFFYELFNSEGWLNYIGDRNIKTLADAQKQIVERYIPSYKKNGYGSYLVVEKSTNKPIGTCGMYKRENLDHPDIGFAFLGKFIGKGYGYESAKVVLDDAEKRLKISKVLAFTIKENKVSIQLLKKLGFHLEGDYFLENQSEPLLLFSN